VSSTLRSALATPEGKHRYVRQLFSTIANRYDLITGLLSYGQDQRWKRRLVDLAEVDAGTRVLDLACGTGDIAYLAAARGARVVGLDITSRMIELARAKTTHGRSAAFLVGDMTSLPFRSGSFDLVTTGYGIRNVPVIEPALAEIFRVLAHGGRLLSLDFNRPESAPARVLYLSYLSVVGSVLGFALHGDPDTYRYIPESIKRYPGARGVVSLLSRSGFRDARYLPVLGGLMAIHLARK
jgi:demethylmenaquinone methyltransferase/2-methoxy-6-polyprenyl-1,4-benzoquinol methylase